MHDLFTSNRELRRDKASPDVYELRPCWRNISNLVEGGVGGVGKAFRAQAGV